MLDLIPNMSDHRTDLNLATGVSDVIINSEKLIFWKGDLSVNSAVVVLVERCFLVLSIHLNVCRACRTTEYPLQLVDNTFAISFFVGRNSHASQITDRLENLVYSIEIPIVIHGEAPKLSLKRFLSFYSESDLRPNRVLFTDILTANLSNSVSELNISVSFSTVSSDGWCD